MAKVNSLRISHNFQDIHCGNVHYLDLDHKNEPRSNIITPVDSPYITWYVISMIIFNISIILSNIFIVEMYFSLTFRMDQSQMQIYKSKARVWLPFIVNSNLYHICHYLRDNHIRTFEIFPISKIWLGNRCSIAFCVVHQWDVKSHICRFPMLEIGKFWIFTFKISMKITNLDINITKAHNCCQTETIAIARLDVTSGVTCSRQKRTKTKQK